jgi:hypothetical protein
MLAVLSYHPEGLFILRQRKDSEMHILSTELDKFQNSVLNLWFTKYTLPTAHVSDTCLLYVCYLSVAVK